MERRSPWTTSIPLFALFVLESLVFYGQLFDQVAPYYPRSFDQASYFNLSFGIVEQYLSMPLFDFLTRLTSQLSGTGWTFPIQGSLLAILAGVGRTSMVSLNLIYFVALQIVLFASVLTRIGRLSIAWIALSLLLTASTLFLGYGGLLDYRIDFSAMCLYGIWCCAIFKSHGFRERNWSIAAGVIGAWLILMRFLTIAYVGSATLLIFIALMIMGFRAKPRDFGQAVNALICGIITLVMIAPAFFAARELIYQYYGVGHFLGDEKNIRAAEFGLSSISDHLFFYPANLWNVHMGTAFVVLSAILLCLSFLYRRGRRGGYRFDLSFLLLTVLVPLAVLNLDTSKSPVVFSIVIVPSILGVIVIAASNGISLMTSRFVASASMVVGIVAFVTHASNRQHYLSSEDLATVNRLNGDIAKFISVSKVTPVHIAFDRVSEYLHAGIVQITLHEMMKPNYRAAPQVIPLMGNIFSISREQAIQAVDRSDIAVMSDRYKSRDTTPLNSAISTYWPDLNEKVNREFYDISSGVIDGTAFKVYARPVASVSGAEQGWITSDGIMVNIDRGHMDFSNVVIGSDISGIDTTVLGGMPVPTATDTSGRVLPVTFKGDGSSYMLSVDIRELSSDAAAIKIVFDRYFIPAMIGTSRDTRKLVTRSPTFLRMLRPE